MTSMTFRSFLGWIRTRLKYNVLNPVGKCRNWRVKKLGEQTGVLDDPENSRILWKSVYTQWNKDNIRAASEGLSYSDLWRATSLTEVC